MKQHTLITNLLKNNKDAIFISSLGTISKDMGDVGVKVKGAMGCVLGVALGCAMNTNKKVICIIGEGSFLMKLGSIATIAKYKPKNLKIIILNNGKYASCGGQKNNYDSLPADVRKNFNRGSYQSIKVS